MISRFFTCPLENTKTRSKTCTVCGRRLEATTPQLTSNFLGSQTLIVVDTPTQTDDSAGYLGLRGGMGRLVADTLRKLGTSPNDDCFVASANRCFSSKKQTVTQIECCRKNLLALIKEKQPKVIIPMGEQALFALIGHRYPDDLGGFEKWRGWVIPDQELGCFIAPVWHPQDVINANRPEMDWWFKRDLQFAVSYAKHHPFPKYKEPVIEVIEDLSTLDKITEGTVSVDLETTGIKPHAPGHRIVTAAIATSPDHAYAFMMPETRSARAPFVRLMENHNVKKMGHNIKFEHTWIETRLKAVVQPWSWDSMLAAHILDNRPGICGLKFQTYVTQGIMDYSSDVSPYLKSGGARAGANELNRVMELCNTSQGRVLLLRYNALDTIHQYRLSIHQKNRLIGCRNK